MTTTSPNDLCPGCFAVKGEIASCPHCGYDENAERGLLLLPHRTVLHGQYVVGRILGKPGGFGITYLGWDLNLETRVAIKEYLPRDLAGRAGDHASIAPHSREDGELFRYGLEQFLREARTLAQLDHPNIVRVRQFFEANGTAYLVMGYYDGISLAEYLDHQGGRLPEETAKQLLLPVLDGLRAVHAKGFLHRDIKPENVYLARTDFGGVRPILLDFGAARQAMGERSRSLSVVVSPGYAPFEQYHTKGSQGPWTDVYSVAAVLYRMVTGAAPPEATERISEDDLTPAVSFGVSQRLSDALGEALAVTPQGRPRDVHAFQARLLGEESSRPTTSPPAPQPPDRPAPPQPPPPIRPGSRWWLGSLAVLGGWALAAGINYFAVVAPNAALPGDLAKLHTEVAALAKSDRARETIDRYFNAGQAALGNEDRDGAREALAKLKDARTILGQEYTVRIVNRPGENTGVWRIPDVNTGARNYYIIVEAVDPSGAPLSVPIENEETKKIERVEQWGLRVDERTFRAVAEDKRDDGIIEQDRFGYKAPGDLVPHYEMKTTGGAITDW